MSRQSWTSNRHPGARDVAGRRRIRSPASAAAPSGTRAASDIASISSARPAVVTARRVVDDTNASDARSNTHIGRGFNSKESSSEPPRPDHTLVVASADERGCRDFGPLTGVPGAKGFARGVVGLLERYADVVDAHGLCPYIRDAGGLGEVIVVLDHALDVAARRARDLGHDGPRDPCRVSVRVARRRARVRAVLQRDRDPRTRSRVGSRRVPSVDGRRSRRRRSPRRPGATRARSAAAARPQRAAAGAALRLGRRSGLVLAELAALHAARRDLELHGDAS